MASGWHVSVERIGVERRPVVVIDGFAPRPGLLRDDAELLSFRAIGEHYPGIRAVIAPALFRRQLADLKPIADETFDLDGFDLIDAFYSLVTTPPQQLAPIQRLPHFDGVERGWLALLHYLSPEPCGGTAFYRHRATGFETVDAARLTPYRSALDADLRRCGVPDADYIGGDTELFEQIAAFEPVYNRAILYHSNSLHCAIIPPDASLSADPLRGRLTANLFLMGRDKN